MTSSSVGDSRWGGMRRVEGLGLGLGRVRRLDIGLATRGGGGTRRVRRVRRHR